MSKDWGSAFLSLAVLSPTGFPLTDASGNLRGVNGEMAL